MKKLIPLFFLLPVAASAIDIASFEGDSANWEIKPNGGATLEVTTEAAHVKDGKGAGALAVDYVSPATGAVSFPVPENADITSEGSLTFWLFGDGSGAGLQWSVVAEDGGIFAIEKKIDWTGWEKVEIPVKTLVLNRFGGAPESAAETLDPAAIRTVRLSTYASLKADDDKKTFYIDTIELNP